MTAGTERKSFQSFNQSLSKVKFLKTILISNFSKQRKVVISNGQKSASKKHSIVEK